MLYIFGIAVSFFLCLVLLGKKNKTIADKVLWTWLLLIGVHLSLFYLYFTEKFLEFPSMVGVGIPFPLIQAPMLYFYTSALCRQRLPKRWWLHLSPVIAAYIYLIPFFFLPLERKLYIVKHQGEGYETFKTLVIIGINLSGIVYSFISHRLLQKHREVIADLFSYQEDINLQWLQYLIYGLAGIWAAVLIGYEPLTFGAVVMFVFFIGFFGIRQVGIFSSPPALQLARAEYPEDDFQISVSGHHHAEMHTSDNVPPDQKEAAYEAPDSSAKPDRKKYEKSGLTPEAAETLHKRLKELIDSCELYRESDLSLTDLAEQLEVHPNYLSQIINDKEGKNFYDYINSMRMDAFLKMAAEPENLNRYTLLALAMECGFNSKSSFNRYFKKTTGKSPTEYLENV